MRRVGAVHLERFGGFVRDVHDAGDGRLHAESHLVLGDGGAELVNEGVVDGRYTWRVNVPITISYASDDPKAKPKQPDNVLTSIQIVKTSPQENPEGIAINSLIEKPGKNP